MAQLKMKNGTVKPIDAKGFFDGGEVVGAVEYNNFGRAVNSFTFVQVMKHGDSLNWQYKNGKQRVFLLLANGKKLRGKYSVVP